MTTISPNYSGVNFRATEQVQPKKAETPSAQTKTASKGMSNAAKVGIGLGALATVAIAGLAIKKGLNKPISINTKQYLRILLVRLKKWINLKQVI